VSFQTGSDTRECGAFFGSPVHLSLTTCLAGSAPRLREPESSSCNHTQTVPRRAARLGALFVRCRCATALRRVLARGRMGNLWLPSQFRTKVASLLLSRSAHNDVAVQRSPPSFLKTPPSRISPPRRSTWPPVARAIAFPGDTPYRVFGPFRHQWSLELGLGNGGELLPV
jgi:hypothetical protein